MYPDECFYLMEKAGLCRMSAAPFHVLFEYLKKRDQWKVEEIANYLSNLDPRELYRVKDLEAALAEFEKLDQQQTLTNSPEGEVQILNA